jgi:hypothetical protein
MDGLIRLRRPEEVAELRGLTVSQVLGLDGNGNGAATTISDEGPAAEAESAPAEEAPVEDSGPSEEEQSPADETPAKEGS